MSGGWGQQLARCVTQRPGEGGGGSFNRDPPKISRSVGSTAARWGLSADVTVRSRLSPPVTRSTLSPVAPQGGSVQMVRGLGSLPQRRRPRCTHSQQNGQVCNKEKKKKKREIIASNTRLCPAGSLK